MAQTVLSGTVTDKSSGRPLARATIQLVDLKRSTLTDEKGGYQLDNLPQQRFVIRLSHVGYTTVTDSVDLAQNAVRNYALEPASRTLEEVLVMGNAQDGYRFEQAQTGPLGNIPLKDTPYSVNVTSGDLIENRSAHTLADALQTNPTVALLASSNAYSSLSRMMIRGFTAADQSELRDGMTDRSFTFPHLENVARIEVLNGLSSFLYGFSSIGGTINYVSKQPTATPLASLALGSYGNGTKYIHADLGGYTMANDRLGYRVNAYREEGPTYIQGGQQRRTLFSGVFDYRLWANTHLKLDITQQDYLVQGLQTYFLPLSTATELPAAFDPSKQYGQPWTYNESQKTQLGIGLESKLNSVFSLRTAFRYNDMWRKYSYVAAKLTSNEGNTYQEIYWDSPRQYQATHSGYAYLDANLKTGSVQHALTAGYSVAQYFYQRGVDINVLLGTSTVDAPSSFTVPAYATTQTTYQGQVLSNIQLSDRISFSPSWQALIGLNYSSIQQTAGGVATSISTSNYSQSQVTPSASLVFKPISAVSIYGSYMQGLAAGGFAPATATNANQQLAPSMSDQYEVGAKATIGALDLTTALFRINKINEYTDPTDQVYKQDGRQVHQGIELTATGKLTQRLTLIGGFTFLKARMQKAANNTAIEGKIPINVPQQQVRLYLEYAIPGLTGLTWTAAVNYFGKRPTNALNTLFLPDVTTIDTGLRYQLAIKEHKLGLHLNIGNLLNKAYWANYRDGDGLQLGSPRMTSFGIKYTL
ncbi:TonB-dependent receptor [Spirosoma arboris]|nr:TonB-dependent receptor [Spirosoma arboris]